MKKILFPTDFSEVANNAFIFALEFAKTIQGEIVLLHTFELPIFDSQVFPDNYQYLYDSIELSNFEKFKDEIPKLRSVAEERNLDHIKLSHKLMDGDLIHNIKEAIHEEKIDFVVMGTSGATGWKEMFIGTNTGEVLTSISVPVLTVPYGAKFEKFETIGFTTRFREKDKLALYNILKIAKKLNADVKCLYVKTSNSDISVNTAIAWEKEFENEKVKFFVIPNDNIEETILEFINSQGIDILGMMTYKKNFFVELFTTSFTEKMSYHTNIPILAMHE